MTKTKTKYIDNFVNKLKNWTKMLGRNQWRRDGCAQVLNSENSRSTSSQHVTLRRVVSLYFQSLTPEHSHLFSTSPSLTFQSCFYLLTKLSIYLVLVLVIIAQFVFSFYVVFVSEKRQSTNIFLSQFQSTKSTLLPSDVIYL